VARSYDPATGQFLTPDPLTTLTRTPYAYTDGNPLQHADPTGLIDGATCTWWLLSCGGLDEDITGSTAVVAVNFGRGATGGLTDTIVNRISPGASCTIDNTSLQARTSQALGFAAAMLPGSITTGGAAAATRNTATTTTRTATEAGVAAADEWPVISGIVRDAGKGKGNFGIGSGTAGQAETAGRAWVGDGSRLASDGKTLLSRDSLWQWRPPSYKPKLDKWQSNFESRWEPFGQWQTNGHLDIMDLS
jgi:hypothetical protein